MVTKRISFGVSEDGGTAKPLPAPSEAAIAVATLSSPASAASNSAARPLQVVEARSVNGERTDRSRKGCWNGCWAILSRAPSGILPGEGAGRGSRSNEQALPSWPQRSQQWEETAAVHRFYSD